MPPPLTILHLDMDAFFAQVEQMRDPSLKGKPVCVGGIPGEDRSVVASASYEARKFGIRAAMPLRQAQKACPHAVFLRGHYKLYQEVSKRVVKILEDYSDRVQPSSIDESYVDITGVLKYWGGAEAIGRGIKKRVVDELRLTCSIGIAPTRTLAKICTDLNKPDGLTIIGPDDLERVIFPLPVEKIPGVGAKMKKSLNTIGIFTIGQLAGAPQEQMFKRFGVYGPQLQEIVRGQTNREVHTEDERPDEKSIGNSRTFGQDTADRELLRTYLLAIVQMVGRRVREADMAGRTVTLTIRYGDFHTLTARRSLPRLTSDENEIFRLAWKLFEERAMPGVPLRLLGVSLSGLVPKKTAQTDLFEKENKVFKAMDAIKDKFGEGVIGRSSTLGVKIKKGPGK
jgi:DNA polymerase-4